jgi:hypothetical protein
MRSVRFLTLVALALAVGACDENPLTTKGPDAPLPPTEGIQAFLQVSDDHAQPGQQVDVYVKVQFGTETDAKLGSYTGRLTFDPQSLAFVSSTEINDGMRVVNPNGAANGELRFAGAAARGFQDLTIYHGVFEVKNAGYMDQLKMAMEELSAATTLSNLQPQLQVTPQIFLRQSSR